MKHEGTHDVAGLLNHELDNFGRIETRDKPLQLWEYQMHALLVVLASHKPAYITTDELRRVVEGLEPKVYLSWGYYEKWASAFTSILLERGVITQTELDEALAGDEAAAKLDGDLPAIFQEGDLVRVRSEDSRLRWRRPHLRCPGYIFGLVGRVQKYIGTFDDPFALAFRGKAPKQPLYTVIFPMASIWSTSDEHASKANRSFSVDLFDGDCVEAEVYQEWLEAFDPSKETVGKEHAHNHAHAEEEHRHGEESSHIHHADVCDRTESHHEDNHDHSHGHDHGHESGHCDHHEGEHDHHHDQKKDHHNHDDHHDHDHHKDHDKNSHDHRHDHHEDKHREEREEEHDHSHSHEHGHSHENRKAVEQRAHELEGESDSPGKVIGLTLLRLLYRKQITNPQQIAKTVDALENAGKRLLGAELVVRAWKDEGFKQRLLSDASKAAGEIDIVTSNPNAPTVLRVVENRPNLHNLIVCTLCSCYPSALLGLSPSWYKSRNYRARAVREPRKVLEEFGLSLPQSTRIVVHDSTADCRYLVLPQPPESLSQEDIQRMSVEELKAYVTRDSMIGVAQL